MCIAQGASCRTSGAISGGRPLTAKTDGMDPHVSLSVGVAGRSAKRVFFLHGEDVRGEVILREKLTRERLVSFLASASS